MPIPKHLRHFYRGAQYEAWRARLVERSGNKCEDCHKPNHAMVLTITPLNVIGLRMAWRIAGRPWRDQRGVVIQRLTHMQVIRKLQPRTIRVILTAAHLNNIAGDDRDENGRMLCQWCHLHYDRLLHKKHAKETRLDRKDAARPLLQEAV